MRYLFKFCSDQATGPDVDEVSLRVLPRFRVKPRKNCGICPLFLFVKLSKSRAEQHPLTKCINTINHFQTLAKDKSRLGIP